MGTLVVGGVTGWVAMSQELLGLCVIWLHAVLVCLSSPPTSAPVGCSAGMTVLCFQELKDTEVKGLETLGMSSPSRSYSFHTEA